MRVDDEMKYQIGLSLIDGVGDIIAKKLLIHFGTAKAVFYAKKERTRKDRRHWKILDKLNFIN